MRAFENEKREQYRDPNSPLFYGKTAVALQVLSAIFGLLVWGPTCQAGAIQISAEGAAASLTCDYIATSDSELTTVLANPATRLSGKTVCLSGSFGRHVISKSGLSSTLTITSQDWQSLAKADAWTIATGTNHIKLDHLNFQMTAWPKSQRGVLMLGSTAGALDDVTISNSVIRHGYGNSNADYDVTAGCDRYPEYCEASPNNITDKLAYAIARDGALTTLTNITLNYNISTDVSSGFKFQVDGGKIAVQNNALDRIYEDCLTFAADAAVPSSLLIQWNTCTHQFQADTDIADGHPDFIQLFGTESTPNWTGITIQGNRQVVGVSRGLSQGIFLQGIGPKSAPSKWGAFIAGNFLSTRNAPLEIYLDYAINSTVAYNTAVRNDPADFVNNIHAGQINIGGYGMNSGSLCVVANIGEAVSFANGRNAPTSQPSSLRNIALGLHGARISYRSAFNGPFNPDSISSAMTGFTPRVVYSSFGAIGTIVDWNMKTVDTTSVHNACGF